MSPHGSFLGPAERLRAYIRRILARLPQSAMLHQRRLLFLLASQKSQPQPPSSVGHSLIRWSPLAGGTSRCRK